MRSTRSTLCAAALMRHRQSAKCIAASAISGEPKSATPNPGANRQKQTPRGAICAAFAIVMAIVTPKRLSGHTVTGFRLTNSHIVTGKKV